jgi:hypothetical protein
LEVIISNIKYKRVKKYEELKINCKIILKYFKILF